MNHQRITELKPKDLFKYGFYHSVHQGEIFICLETSLNGSNDMLVKYYSIDKMEIFTNSFWVFDEVSIL